MLKGALFILALPLATSCASAPTFADLATEHDGILALSESLEAMGRFPSAAVLAPDAELVTFRYRAPDGDAQRRDTIRGRAAVAAWLDHWHARQMPDVDFVLSPHDFRRCQGVALQTGMYPIKGSGRGAQVESQSYRALWTETRGGEWELKHLWLEAGGGSPLRGRSTDCLTLRVAERRLHKVVVGLEVLASGTPSDGTIEDAMRSVGWTSPVNRQGFPYSKADKIGFALGARYRVTPQLGVHGLLLRHPATLVSGRVARGPREPSVLVTNSWIAFLGSLDLGIAQIEAGPGFSVVGFEWAERVHNVGGGDKPDPLSESLMKLGALAQISVSAPVRFRVQPRLVARYVYSGDAEVPGYMDLEAFTVPLNRFSLSLGLEYSFR